jgi:hypothetical protein
MLEAARVEPENVVVTAFCHGAAPGEGERIGPKGNSGILRTVGSPVLLTQ